MTAESRTEPLAFGEIILLAVAVLATPISFWNVRRLAGLLMVPYVLWVAFAAILNYTIWRLNIGDG